MIEFINDNLKKNEEIVEAGNMLEEYYMGKRDAYKEMEVYICKLLEPRKLTE